MIYRFNTRPSEHRTMDTWMIFKWVFKSAAAILIVTNTWNIVMGVFDMAQSVVAQAAGIINSDASIDISSVMTDLPATEINRNTKNISTNFAGTLNAFLAPSLNLLRTVISE